jgi:hypothetical protein
MTRKDTLYDVVCILPSILAIAFTFIPNKIDTPAFGSNINSSTIWLSEIALNNPDTSL